MVWYLVPLLWVHVFCMSFWLGSAIFATVLGGQPKLQAVLDGHELTRRLAPRLNVVFPVAILTGVLTGIALGTIFGPIRSVGALFNTAYGLTMVLAFLLVVVALAVGPAAPPAWKPAWVGRLHVGEATLVGAFTCMMFMRVGL
jgi:putative copper export protein